MVDQGACFNGGSEHISVSKMTGRCYARVANDGENESYKGNQLHCRVN